MKCPRCGSDVEKGWKFCPRCGDTLQRGGFFSIDIGRIFDRFQKMQEEMSKSVEKDFEVFDLSPAFGKPLKKNARGFTIRIKRIGDGEPKVSVKTFGDVDRETVREEVAEMAGDMGVKSERKPQKELPLPKRTEEPEARVRRLDSSLLVEMDVPGVKSEGDVRITELENSVEVRAVAGDKAYFKILTKPGDYRITGKKLEKGKLVIEFS